MNLIWWLYRLYLSIDSSRRSSKRVNRFCVTIVNRQSSPQYGKLPQWFYLDLEYYCWLSTNKWVIVRNFWQSPIKQINHKKIHFGTIPPSVIICVYQNRSLLTFSLIHKSVVLHQFELVGNLMQHQTSTFKSTDLADPKKPSISHSAHFFCTRTEDKKRNNVCLCQLTHFYHRKWLARFHRKSERWKKNCSSVIIRGQRRR